MRWARTSHCPRVNPRSQREYDLVGVQFLYVRRRATHIGSYSYGGTGYPNLHAVTISVMQLLSVMNGRII
jgi:hypothetical protein